MMEFLSPGEHSCLRHVSVLFHPANRFPHQPGSTSVAQPDHRGVARVSTSLDATPAPILPPPHSVDQPGAVDQTVCVTNDSHPVSHIGNVGHRRAEIKELPAHMSNIVNAGSRSGQVPIDERHGPQSAPTIAIHRVLRSQIIWGKAGEAEYKDALQKHIDNPDTKHIQGTYRGDPAILNYNPNTGLVVVQSPTGGFVTGWKVNSEQAENILQRGSLGGG
ncbi:colicin D domain-containing protein [Nocardia brasiliensis]|uniref:colicin D domain-containing protein n=1 Tax=Nocardia brasiliensis TaxID=37326 RepID=UPI003D912549